MGLVGKFFLTHTMHAQLFTHEPSTQALRNLIDLTKGQSSDAFVRLSVSTQTSETLLLKLYPFYQKLVIGEDWDLTSLAYMMVRTIWEHSTISCYRSK